MIMKYEWGIYQFPVAAEIVGKHCEQIEKENGTITREILLESARSQDSCIHSLFEWNDTIAAEKYRLHQAGNVLSSLKVTVMRPEKADEPVTTKAWVQVERQEHKAVYMNVQSAMSGEKTRQQVLKIALAELATFKHKYETLTELSAVFEAIDMVLADEKQTQ